MKKRLFFIVINLFLLIPISVKAASPIATFQYSFKHYDLSLNFSFELQNDGTLVKEYDNNDFFEGSDLINYFGKKSFDVDFLSLVYKNGKLIQNVPTLYYCKNDGVNFYNIYSYPTECLPGVSSTPIYGSLEVIDDNEVEPSKAKTICERTRSIRNDYSVKIKFFLDAEGNKKFSVNRIGGSNEGGDAEAYGGISVNRYTFFLDDDVIETMYESVSSCNNTPLFFRTDGTDGTVMYLTNEKPDAIDNGSFSPGEADGDHGSNIGGEDDGSFVDDSKLCKDDNCNISLSGLCNETKVARTLKFLGILITLVKIFVPLLIIVLGSIDFAKAMIEGKGDDIPKKVPVLIKRFITGVIIFLVPSVIDFLFGVIDTYSDTMNQYENCWTCLLDPDECKVND